MKTAVSIFILIIVVFPLYGFNSLVRHEDIPKMRELGISQEVIQYIISNQTSSVSSEDTSCPLLNRIYTGRSRNLRQ